MDKKEMLQHLNQMVEDYENFIIPAQDNEETIELLEYDKSILQETINYLNND